MQIKFELSLIINNNNKKNKDNWTLVSHDLLAYLLWSTTAAMETDPKAAFAFRPKRFWN